MPKACTAHVLPRLAQAGSECRYVAAGGQHLPLDVSMLDMKVPYVREIVAASIALADRLRLQHDAAPVT
jgi:hypothetical protein